jgi:hypothetical protein
MCMTLASETSIVNKTTTPCCVVVIYYYLLHPLTCMVIPHIIIALDLRPTLSLDWNVSQNTYLELNCDHDFQSWHNSLLIKGSCTYKPSSSCHHPCKRFNKKTNGGLTLWWSDFFSKPTISITRVQDDQGGGWVYTLKCALSKNFVVKTQPFFLVTIALQDTLKKSILRQKEELWKLKYYFTVQKYNNLLKIIIKKSS